MLEMGGKLYVLADLFLEKDHRHLFDTRLGVSRGGLEVVEIVSL